MNKEWIQIWMAKYNNRIGEVRKHMLRRNHSTDGNCPCCGEIEDMDHTLKCTNDDLQEIYKDKM